MGLREDANYIINKAIEDVLPDEAVKKALYNKEFNTGKIYVVAAGKAAWQMAKTASEVLGNKIETGIVITKYEHVKGSIPMMDCYEAGHPVPDYNSYKATMAAIELVSHLEEEDTILFLLSGGASALFEKPLIEEDEMEDITKQLLACGASIIEINTIRKRLSAVKGGKFAKICEPASIYAIVLSDVLGDRLDVIASGPAYPDVSTSEDALNIVNKYNLRLNDDALNLLKEETPKEIDNVETMITGSVKNLCSSAMLACKELGYEPIYLTDQLTCQAKDAGSFLASIAKSHQNTDKSLAFIAGGETVVELKGQGKGGRNQELALSAAIGIDGLKSTAIFSVGSDGTDGPTDAAGGYVDITTYRRLKEKGIDIYNILKENDAYNALKVSDGLVITGPTGTNVNDVSIVLIKR